jgi:recombination protein RecT
MTTQLQAANPGQLVKQRMATMIESLPGTGTARKRFAQAAIGVCSQPAIAKCTPESVCKAIYACARLGLIPDPVLHLAAIVPFRNHGKLEATLIIEYRGIVELAKRADSGLYIDCNTVYEGDEYFLEEGLRPDLRILKRWWEKGLPTAGPAVFSYCVSGQSNGERAITVVSAQEGLKIGNASKAGRKPGTPWHDHEDRMREKTCVHRASRFWKLATDSDATRQFREAIEYDGADTADMAAPVDSANILGDMGELPGQEEPGQGLEEGSTRRQRAPKKTKRLAAPDGEAEEAPAAVPAEEGEKRKSIFFQLIDVKLVAAGRATATQAPTPFDRESLVAHVVGAEGDSLRAALSSAGPDDYLAWAEILKATNAKDLWAGGDEA